MVCARRSRDPLLRLFLDEYRVNLLEIPRARVDLGSVFVVQGRSVDNVPLAEVLDGNVEVVPETEDPTVVETVSKKTSGSLDMSASASLVGRMLAAVGIPGDEPSIKGALQRKGGYEAVVTIAGLTVRRARRGKFADALRGRAVRDGGPWADGALYVCTGTWAARSLEMKVTSDRGGHVEADVALKEVLEAGGKVSISRGALAETVFTSSDPLVFGVELMSLVTDAEGLRLKDHQPERQMRGENEREREELAVVEIDQDNAFLRLGSRT